MVPTAPLRRAWGPGSVGGGPPRSAAPRSNRRRRCGARGRPVWGARSLLSSPERRAAEARGLPGAGRHLGAEARARSRESRLGFQTPTVCPLRGNRAPDLLEESAKLVKSANPLRHLRLQSSAAMLRSAICRSRCIREVLEDTFYTRGGHETQNATDTERTQNRPGAAVPGGARVKILSPVYQTVGFHTSTKHTVWVQIRKGGVECMG